MDGPARNIIRAGFRTVVAMELGFHRLRDRLTQRDSISSEELDLVTAVIKTFERRDRLDQLLQSMNRIYPGMKLIVVDDSKEPIDPRELPGVEVVHLPFESGVSKGRSAGLERVTTPYFMNVDDDFVFCNATRLSGPVRYLERNPEVDLVAAQVPYLPYYTRHNYYDDSLLGYKREPILEKGTIVDGLRVHEKCSNCFVARTAKVRELGWIPQLKRLDHADFFARARGALVCVEDPDFQVLHVPTRFNAQYLRYRLDYRESAKYLDREYGD